MTRASRRSDLAVFAAGSPSLRRTSPPTSGLTRRHAAGDILCQRRRAWLTVPFALTVSWLAPTIAAGAVSPRLAKMPTRVAADHGNNSEPFDMGGL